MAVSRSKKSRVSDLALQPNADIDPNTCCTCFVRYEDDIIRGAGTEWIYVPVEGGCMSIVQKIVLQMLKGMTVLAQYVWTFLWPKLCQVYFMTVKTLYFSFPSSSKLCINVGVSEFICLMFVQ